MSNDADSANQDDAGKPISSAFDINSLGDHATVVESRNEGVLLDPDHVIAGRFKILRPLGMGGMGVVYQVADQDMAGEVKALKMMRPSLLSSDTARERFVTEARIAQQLTHANIVNTFDLGRDGEFHFITMEYLEGLSLDKELARRNILPWDPVCRIIFRVLKALEYAHSRIIHRDIKPQNLFLRTDGTVKVLDFGLARATDGPRAAHSSATVGTAAYMAPEQEEGQEATIRSDLYSVGVVLYQCLTGRLPRGRFRLPSQIDPTIPAWIDAVVETLLDPYPENRPENAGSVSRQMLEGYQRKAASVVSSGSQGSGKRKEGVRTGSQAPSNKKVQEALPPDMHPKKWLEASLSHAQRIPPSFDKGYLLANIARGYVTLGDVPGACQIVEQYIPASPTGPRETVYGEILEKQLQDGDIDAAEMTCQALPAGRPKLGSARASRGDLSGAWRVVDSLSFFDGQYHDHCEQIIGDIIAYQVKSGDMAGAEASAERLVSLVCEAESRYLLMPNAAMVRATVQGVKTLSSSELAERERTYAYSCMALAVAQGDNAESAFKLLERMGDPLDRAITLCEMARTCIARQRHSTAARAYAAARKLAPEIPDSPEVLSRLAHLACEMGEIDQALDIVDLIPLVERPSNPFFCKGAGYSFKYNLKSSGGITERVRVFCVAAIAQNNAGDILGSEETLKRAMRLIASIISSQDRINQIYRVAETYVALGKNETAHEALSGASRILGMMPVKDFCYLHSGLAESLAHAGYYQEAKSVAASLYAIVDNQYSKSDGARLWRAIAESKVAAKLFDDIRGEANSITDPILSTYYCLGVAIGLQRLLEP